MAEPGTSQPTERPIEAADPGSAPDDNEFAPSDIDNQSVSNASTSLRSSIFQHHFENGRRVRIMTSFPFSCSLYLPILRVDALTYPRSSTTSTATGGTRSQTTTKSKIGMI